MQLGWISANRENDPLAALLTFYHNSGQHRFAAAADLQPPDQLYDRPRVNRCADAIETLTEEIYAELPTGRSTEIFEKVTRRWNLKALIKVCACCGVKAISKDPDGTQTIPLSTLQILQYDAAQMEQLLMIPLQYRHVISNFTHHGIVYNLHPEFVNPSQTNPTAAICSSCWNDIVKAKIPHYSIANGVDFGSAARLALPKLTLTEEYLIAKSITLASIVKLTGFGTRKTAKR